MHIYSKTQRNSVQNVKIQVKHFFNQYEKYLHIKTMHCLRILGQIIFKMITTKLGE